MKVFFFLITSVLLTDAVYSKQLSNEKNRQVMILIQYKFDDNKMFDT